MILALSETEFSQMQLTESISPQYASRFDRVDVLALLEPDWLENTQARKLVQMVAEFDRAEARERELEVANA